MHITEVEISNFRSIKHCKLTLDKYTALVGQNGAGKSNVLKALNVFFRVDEGMGVDAGLLTAEDFHLKDTSKKIEIKLTFEGLSQEAAKDMGHYVRHGKLIVSAVAEYNPESKQATVVQKGKRLVIKAFVPMFEGKLKVDEARQFYAKMQAQYPALPGAKTKQQIEDELRRYEEGNLDACEEVESSDQFYGFSKGENLLTKHIQWVYIPAVKDAADEKSERKGSALGRLIDRSVRTKVKFDHPLAEIARVARDGYDAALKAEQHHLEAISNDITRNLSEWAHPDAKAILSWSSEAAKSVVIPNPVAKLTAYETGFDGELERFGHGLQRSYLIALIQTLADVNAPGAPTLVLGFEEPELYQHPPQARYLAEVLHRLPEKNSQVVLTTHSPYFVAGKHFESLRMVRRDLTSNETRVSAVSAKSVSEKISSFRSEPTIPVNAMHAKLEAALHSGLAEMFFASKVVLVEGQEDYAYVMSSLVLKDKVKEFRRKGVHVVPVHGKENFLQPIVIASLHKMPVFVLFDSDGGEPNPQKRNQHETENLQILEALGCPPEVRDPFPTQLKIGANYAQWPSNIGDTLKSDFGQNNWENAGNHATKSLSNPRGSFSKNTLHIGHRLAWLNDNGHQSKALDQVLNAMLEFANL